MKTYTAQKSNSFNKVVTFMIKHIKIFCFLIIFTVMGVVFTSCASRYVSSEPRYDRDYRPLKPSETHIWIEGDWRWNRRSHIYEHQSGYWVLPPSGRYYREGHWETGPRGKYWSKGYWEKSKREAARNMDRDRERDRDRDRN